MSERVYDAYNQEIENAKKIAQALRDDGYRIACYTYSNTGYGEISFAQMQNDLNSWTNEVVPILGNLDMLVYAQLTDITTDGIYSGEKYEALKELGFRYFLGFCNDGQPWTTVANEYVRQGRILVTGSALAYHANWFNNLFDASSVLDTTRGNVPG